MRRSLGIAALWVALAGLSSYLRGEHARMLPPHPPLRIQDVLLDVLGEGKTVLARYLWFKMDLMHEQLDDVGKDVFLQDDVVPLLRMIQFLDPHFVDAYDTLAYDLYRGHQQLDEAIAVVEEGLAYNPDSFELLFRRAFLAEKKKDWATTLESSRKALAVADEELRRLTCLRTMYRCAVAYDDAGLGLEVAELLQPYGIPPMYQAKIQRWRMRQR